jgi:hypothetical protein
MCHHPYYQVIKSRDSIFPRAKDRIKVLLKKVEMLIKRKLDVLRKEISLLSKLILDNSGKSEDIIYRIKEVDKLSSFDNRNSNKELNQQITDNQSTNYGNINSENLHSGIKKIEAQEDLES